MALAAEAQASVQLVPEAPDIPLVISALFPELAALVMAISAVGIVIGMLFWKQLASHGGPHD